MATSKRKERRTAAVLAKAIKDAEDKIEHPPGRIDAAVKLRPSQIFTLPELFQPRTFSQGLRELDTLHVKKLQRRIRIEGELDPPTIVKLDGVWVCVDGHHRLEAYKREEWSRKINCRWFGGTAKQAVDEAAQENKKIKLEMAQGDKFEQAWMRVVLDWGSKRDIVRTTGVSQGTVAMMRRVKLAYSRSKELQEKIGNLRQSTWSYARAAYLNLDPKVQSIQEEAAKLARVLANRLTDKLSRDPEVTAKALAIYDPDLPAPLTDALLRGRYATPKNESEGLK